ncbi:MAG: FAD synthase [Thermoplasmata archaeon]|nr:FAD synthase [Euryarchaeota archaeon]RLF65373.1 MAG: FAD synthase [Thermoplasmata archaeon]
MQRRVRVVVGGVFDILHPGHIYFLKRAKELGDELIVIIARDSTVLKRKGRRPILPEEIRREIVEALKPVDKAILGHEGEDLYKIVEELRPDIIALGYDQDFDPEELKRELARRGLNVKVVRIDKYNHELAATRRIISKIMEVLSNEEENRNC